MLCGILLGATISFLGTIENMRVAGNIRLTLCAVVMALVSLCLASQTANSALIGIANQVTASTSKEKRPCKKLTAPQQQQKKCSRVTVSVSSPTGRVRGDDSNWLSLFATINTGIVTWLPPVQHGRSSPLEAVRWYNGRRAPFWQLFASAPRLRN